jgi:L-methionine (R)-S-oxide reductase
VSADAALSADAHDALRSARYAEVRARIEAVLEGETDWIAAMATVACELHTAFAYFHWTGFYRHVGGELLVIGPYQGGHGCLRIPFSRGVCGAAARTRATQRVPDVEAFPGHIACASTTRSEIVVPLVAPDGRVIAVLDVDSDLPDAFSAEVDQPHLESLCAWLAERWANEAR